MKCLRLKYRDTVYSFKTWLLNNGMVEYHGEIFIQCHWHSLATLLVMLVSSECNDLFWSMCLPN
jgi:hypothetical protein